jgi:hypothetical protein
MIAKKIIKIAQTGVHDAAQLSALAITQLTKHPVRPPQLAAFFSSNVACWQCAPKARSLVEEESTQRIVD